MGQTKSKSSKLYVVHLNICTSVYLKRDNFKFSSGPYKTHCSYVLKASAECLTSTCAVTRGGGAAGRRRGSSQQRRRRTNASQRRQRRRRRSDGLEDVRDKLMLFYYSAEKDWRRMQSMSVNGQQSLVFIKDELEARKSWLLEIWSVRRHWLYYGYGDKL